MQIRKVHIITNRFSTLIAKINYQYMTISFASHNILLVFKGNCERSLKKGYCWLKSNLYPYYLWGSEKCLSVHCLMTNQSAGLNTPVSMIQKIPDPQAVNQNSNPHCDTDLVITIQTLCTTLCIITAQAYKQKSFKRYSQRIQKNMWPIIHAHRAQQCWKSNLHFLNDSLSCCTSACQVSEHVKYSEQLRRYKPHKYVLRTGSFHVTLTLQAKTE